MSSLALAARAHPLYHPSNFAIGNLVHRRIQDGYVQARSAVADIVAERWNAEQQRVEQVVIGPVTSGTAMPLGDLARAPTRDPDWFFRCLRFSLASPRLNRETWLRADLIDRARSEIWEIKPVAGAASGVWQEAMYRNGFNLLQALIECRKITPVVTDPLRGGGSLVVPSVGRMRGAASGSFSVLSPINVTRQAGQPAFAFPYQVAILPGLLPYLVMRGPDLRQLIAIFSALFARALSRPFARRVGSQVRPPPLRRKLCKRPLVGWRSGLPGRIF